jgi:ATP-dependent exoDNAse (exonuclease V) beta subunit
VSASSFKIYNASAGSGKTYTLVKDYIKIVLTSNAYLPHRHILAITFTNKAVDEMKSRIVAALLRFSSSKILDTKDDLFFDLVKELDKTPKFVHEKSKQLIQKILHNYGGFDVSTIDKFNQRLIRTFAYDLRLPVNFEVELDTDTLLQKAVDQVISKTGKDEALTRVLLDYAIAKSDDDKSWDIALDLFKSAKLLTQETALPYLEILSNQKLEAFDELKAKINKEYKILEQQTAEAAIQILELIKSKGISFSDFTRGSLPKHFSSLGAKKFDIKFDAVWQKNIETTSLYTKKTPDAICQQIDNMRSDLVATFESTKRAVYRLRYLKNIKNNLTPLSVLTLIQNEINNIKRTQNLLLISEFNTIIGNEIKEQPAPFIYERIGDKFNHYFIDEFQDTSELQWSNLTPLIINTVASENGSVLLVGDPKQSIYRWRGGNPEQFITLKNNNHDLPVQAAVSDLPVNYRSTKQVVKFNNDFFSYCSKVIFSDTSHRDLYESASQDFHKKKNGYVHLSFLDFEKGADKNLLYADEVYKTILKYKGSSTLASYKDICVLVRKRKEGVAIANYLISKGLDIISNETLLIVEAKEVQLIINILSYLLHNDNSSAKLNILNYIIDRYEIEDGHQFRLNFLSLNLFSYFAGLNQFGINFNPRLAVQLSVYELSEYIISTFNLVKGTNAHVQFFLDIVFEFSQKQTSSLSQFLVYFEQKKNALSIVSPKGLDAIQIMTVHKSKGLEFPVVIFPFAELDIYKEIEPKEWMPTGHLHKDFPFFLLNYNKDFKHYGVEGEAKYIEHQSKLELDNINLLYVTLTRASEQLYIIGNASGASKAEENFRSYSDLLTGFLKSKGEWIDGILSYSFGEIEAIDPEKAPKIPILAQKKFISTPKNQLNVSMATKADYFWDSTQKEAIEKGNLIHLLLSKVYLPSDIHIVLSNSVEEGLISQQQYHELHTIMKSIVFHPQLKPYFSTNVEVYNEREIMTSKGQIIIPDRLVITKTKSAVIIDYKTGAYYDKHQQQLEHYASIVKQMGYTVDKTILVYIHPELNIKIDF